MEGLKAALAPGRKGGRPKKLTETDLELVTRPTTERYDLDRPRSLGALESAEIRSYSYFFPQPGHAV